MIKLCFSKIFQKSKIVVQPNLIETTYNDVPQNRSNDIVFLGRINPIKSIDKLIKALPLSDLFMKSEGKLLIIGAARLPEEIVYKKRLEELIIGCKLDEKVVFVGTKIGHEKLELLNYSKVLVLPSESENFGNVITEALSQSTPVIASIGTPWQILKDKKIGWWTSNTPENLAKVLDELYSLSEKEYIDYSLGARKYVEDYLDIKTSKCNNWSNLEFSSISLIVSSRLKVFINHKLNSSISLNEFKVSAIILFRTLLGNFVLYTSKNTSSIYSFIAFAVKSSHQKR